MIKKIVLSFVFIFSIAMGAPSYDVLELNIVAKIENDGSLAVQEEVTYDIDQINGIIYNIDALGNGKIKDLEVFYTREPNSPFLSQAEYSPKNIDGNFTVSEDDGVYRIKLYMSGRDEKKTVVFSYRLTQGVTVYEDIAQLNRKLVGRGWEEKIDKVNIKIELPDNYSKKDSENTYIFGHGALDGKIYIEGNTVFLEQEKFYPGEFIEADILFPKELVPNVDKSLIKREKGKDKILALEKKLAEDANRQREVARYRENIGKTVFVAGILWYLFLVFYIYIKNSKRYHVVNEYGEYFRELPDDYSPSVAGTLVDDRYYPTSKELFAQILELVRKDYLELEEKDKKTTLYLRDEKTPKTKEEEYIIDWFIKDLGDGYKVVLEDIDDVVKTKRGGQEYNIRYERWQTMVYSQMLSLGLKWDKKHKLSISLGLITAMIFFIGGGVLTSYFGLVYFIAYIPLGFVMFPYASSRKRNSKEREEARSRWLAFKKFLVDYSNLEEAKLASIELWEHYFVYGVALGVAKEVAKGYEKYLKTQNITNTRLTGYRNTSLMDMYLYSRAFRGLEKNMENISKASYRAIKNTSNMSSPFGRGGGFSGGSSGGGGGRSGGGAF